ncbi:hypothetical protein JQ616_28310 [Bradyrhizobium tropiciagri]|uniref:HpcH/HpaI aldolase family protein n=1 Tax=Bradyrhizobium tropiciagri TaxID=312253 RepID=UPI001BAC34E9|nr:aldolase/citrate lyase family protein [Bradyrhizobium tropiciagri]MBR0898881.1 hypothetical protein [Bradyrhizobium tropiciagri]
MKADATRQSFKPLWRSGNPQFGIFARLTAPEVYETFTLTSLDVVIIDVEHGSFDRQSLSRCMFAALAGRLTVLVRVPDCSLPAIQHAINVGADGIIVPHVSSAREMETVAQFIRRTAVERAHAGAGRASRQRQTPWPDFQRALSDRLMLIAQIDEPAGIAAAPEIIATKGVDGVFLGRIGLTLAMEADNKSSEVVDAALENICRLCIAGNLSVGLSLPDVRAAASWHAKGVNLFIVDSDYAILRAGIETRMSDFRAALPIDAKPQC